MHDRTEDSSPDRCGILMATTHYLKDLTGAEVTQARNLPNFNPCEQRLSMPCGRVRILDTQDKSSREWCSSFDICLKFTPSRSAPGDRSSSRRLNLHSPHRLSARDTLHTFYMSMYNIWERSHRRSASEQPG